MCSFVNIYKGSQMSGHTNIKNKVMLGPFLEAVIGLFFFFFAATVCNSLTHSHAHKLQRTPPFDWYTRRDFAAADPETHTGRLMTRPRRDLILWAVYVYHQQGWNWLSQAVYVHSQFLIFAFRSMFSLAYASRDVPPATFGIAEVMQFRARLSVVRVCLFAAGTEQFVSLLI